MDEIDEKLLGLLKKDAKTKYTDLSEILNLSAPSVHARVKKLEQSGVIAGYTIDIDASLLALKLCAFIRVTIEGIPATALAESLASFPEVEEFYVVAGEECVLLKVRTTDTAALSLLLDRIRETKGVKKTITSVVLTTPFDRGITPRVKG
jgi:Lrp/AsnC family transcriptional regulator, leucine-responsive regulatory protein